MAGVTLDLRRHVLEVELRAAARRARDWGVGEANQGLSVS
jgi:hypothetical protein